ncbi:MAG: deoxyribose-phosphate aldolase [Opitutaceae bacterium]
MEPINRYLDAAILLPETTRAEMEKAVRACLELDVFSVCVRPCDIGRALALCEGSTTAVCVVLGFPHGAQLSSSKVDEARRYIAAGVDEIDMVANYGWARSGLWDEVRADIAGVAEVTRAAGVPLKVIFETAHLDPEMIGRLVEVSIEAGADFVKTSTGFNGTGATEEAVELMLRTAAGRIKVKPSGGIRDRARAETFVRMGVHRLGVNWSSCVAICRDQPGSPTAGSY